ncbi:MAG: OmpP1/FadL family transporter [Kofleriaceae bacterium]
MRWLVCQLGAIATIALCSPASANPMEVLGFTSRHAGQASAGVATVDDGAALYYDPAGLAVRPEVELSLGTVGAYSRLTIANRRRPLADPFGVQISMRTPLPLGGSWRDRIVVGIGLHLLPRNIARIMAPASDQPSFPYYGDRLSRIVVLPGAAVRVTDDLALGAAVNVLAGLTGEIEASEGALRGIEPRIDERARTVARIIAGAQWRPTQHLKVGAVYRQRFEVPFATTARTMVAGEAFDLDLRASGQFTPHQVVIGAGWIAPRFVASLDAGWAKWSDYRGPYVRVDSVLPLVGAVAANLPRVPFDDTFAVRAGAELFVTPAFAIRSGYGFETSAVPRVQTGVTNLFDGDRHTLAVGAGYQWGRIRVDAHLQLQHIGHLTLDKLVHEGGTYDPFTSLPDEDDMAPGPQIGNPGYPSLRGGGAVISGGLTVEVRP